MLKQFIFSTIVVGAISFSVSAQTKAGAPSAQEATTTNRVKEAPDANQAKADRFKPVTAEMLEERKKKLAEKQLPTNRTKGTVAPASNATDTKRKEDE